MKHSLALGRQGWQIKQDRAIEPTCAGSLLTQRQLIILDKTKFHSHCDQSQHEYGDNVAQQISTHWVMPGCLTCDWNEKVFAPISINTLCPSAIVHSLAFGKRNIALGCGSSNRRRLQASIQPLSDLGTWQHADSAALSCLPCKLPKNAFELLPTQSDITHIIQLQEAS